MALGSLTETFYKIMGVAKRKVFVILCFERDSQKKCWVKIVDQGLCITQNLCE